MKNSSSIRGTLATVVTTVALAAFSLAGVASAQATANVSAQAHWGPGPAHVPGVFGAVTAVSGDTITVSSKGYGQNSTATSYSVDATNATVTKAGAASSVSSIAVGDNLMVQGTVSGTTVTATKIEDGIGGMMNGRGGMGVFGTVASISGTTLSVTSKGRVGPNQSQGSSATTYSVNGANATVTKNGASSAFSSIAVGDTVMVEGSTNGTTVTATKISDGVVPGMGGGPKGPSITGNGEPVVGGTVTTVSGDTVTITNKSNVTYTIDATNATVDKGNATSSVSALATGDNVVVQGTVNGNAVTASSIIDSGASSNTSGMQMGGPRGFMGGLFDGIGNLLHNLFGFF